MKYQSSSGMAKPIAVLTGSTQVPTNASCGAKPALTVDHRSAVLTAPIAKAAR